MYSKNKIAALIVLSIYLLGFQKCYADNFSGPPVPASLDAGVIGRDNLKNLQLEQKRTPAPIEIQIPSIDTNPDPTNPELSFTLKSVNFSGNTIYNNNYLQAIAKDYIGKQVNFNDIQRLTNTITTLYFKNGYVTSFAYIPPQSIQDGNVQINITENVVGKIQINNCKWIKPSYIKNNILKANEVESYKIFNVNDFKESIEEMKQNPNLKADVYVQKGEVSKTTDIIFNVKDKFPISLGLFNDNQGDYSTGLFRTGVTVSDYNLTGYGDSLYANTTLSSGFVGVNTGYSLPIGPYGTKINIGYGVSKLSLGGDYKQNEIEGLSHNLYASLLQPIYKKRNLIISSDLTLDGRHTETTMHNLLYNNYELRALRAGINLTKYDNTGEWVARLENSVGIPILGATDYSDYGIGSSKFYKLNANFKRIQTLPLNVIGICRASFQYTPNALFSVEQFEIGGMSSVRGYEERLVLGDVGYNFSLELLRPVPYMPKITFPFLPDKFKTLDLKNRVNLVLFYDQGYAEKIHDYMSGNYTNFLQSVGFGLKSYVTNFVTVNTDFGIPLGRKRYDKQNAMRFHLYLSSFLN